METNMKKIDNDGLLLCEMQAQAGKPIENQSAREVQKSVKEWNQHKNSKLSVIETPSINKESTTPEPSEHNNDTASALESTDTNTQEGNTTNININNIEEETESILTNAYFQVPQVQAWEVFFNVQEEDTCATFQKFAIFTKSARKL